MKEEGEYQDSSTASGQPRRDRQDTVTYSYPWTRWESSNPGESLLVISA